MAEELSKSSWKTPTTILAIIGLAISLSGNVAQMRTARSADALQRAKEVRESAAADAKVAQDDSIRQVCVAQGKALQTQIDQLQRDISTWSASLLKAKMVLSSHELELDLAKQSNDGTARYVREKVALQKTFIVTLQAGKAEAEAERTRLDAKVVKC